MAEMWMAKAFAKNKGGLHRALDVPEGEKIPASKLSAATHSKNAHVRKMANAANTAKKIGRKRKGKIAGMLSQHYGRKG